jgi:hypothetical protein
MPDPSREFPEGRARRFRATVHGTVFAGREGLLARLREGDAVRLVADPPGQGAPGVWVHLASGDPIGHLPPEIARWLWAWLAGGGRAEAVAVHVGGEDEPSWRRVVLEVTCVR